MHTSNVIKQLPRRSRVLRGYSFHVGPKVTRNDPSWQAEAEAGGGEFLQILPLVFVLWCCHSE